MTTHNPGNHAVRTEQWRYIRYADGSEELYDVAEGPARVDQPRGRPDAHRAQEGAREVDARPKSLRRCPAAWAAS